MWIKTIIAAGIGAITSVAAVAQTPSATPNMDYFFSGSYQGGVTGGNTTGTTGTQGVVGNPNCPQPVEPGGIRPLNWSCPTGTQGGNSNLLAQNPGRNQRGTAQQNPVQRVLQQTPQPTAAQQAMQRQTSQLTPGQRAMLRGNSGRVPTVNTQTGNTGGGSAVNRQLDTAFRNRNNELRAQMAREAALRSGLRTPSYEHPSSSWGTNFRFGLPAQNSANRGTGRGQFGRFSRR